MANFKAKPKKIDPDDIAASVNAKYGRTVVHRAKDAPHRPKFIIPTGSLTINRALGGGVTVPRIAQVYGPSSVYKSTCIYDVIANAQKLRDENPKIKAKRIALIDAERSHSLEYLQQCGIDTSDKLFDIIDDFESGDQLVDIMVDLLESDQYMLICLDSLTVLLSEREMSKETVELIKLQGWAGKFTSQLFKKIHHANRGNTAVVFANQIRDVLNDRMERVRQDQSGYSPTGGHAPKFYSSDVLELKHQKLEQEAEYVKIPIPGGDYAQRKPFKSWIVSVRVEKTRSSGNDNLELFFRYTPKQARIDRQAEVLNLGVMDGIITQKGAYYYYKLPGMKEKKTIAQGYNNAHMALRKDVDLCEGIAALIEAKSRGEKST